VGFLSSERGFLKELTSFCMHSALSFTALRRPAMK
jgi:hypothetical protein